MMTETDFLQAMRPANRDALRERKPLLEALLHARNGNTSEQIEWTKCRLQDDVVPLVQLADGTELALHSRFDPQAEAAKLAAGILPAGLLVICGFGAGYLVEACQHAMDAGSFERILVMESESGLIMSTMQHRDVRSLLADPRIYFVLAADRDAVLRELACYYLPHVFNSIRVVASPVLSRLALQQNVELETWVLESIRHIQSDFVTQSRFGKRWLYNILCNSDPRHRLKAGNRRTARALQLGECAIIGAGPSLENQVPKIRSLQARGVPILACDAALTFCQRNGIRPDVVFSIDGQSIGYLHLLSAIDPLGEPRPGLVVDLCAHPAYARAGFDNHLSGSDHPLLSWLRNRGLDIPYLDCSSGNVGGTMVSWAIRHHARSVHVFGLDFAYFNGKPYARPSFYYDDRLHRSVRTHPLEQLVGSMLLNDELSAETGASGTIQTSPRLQAYRRNFLGSLANVDARILSYGVDTDPNLLRDAGAQAPAAQTTTPVASLNADELWCMLRDYRHALETSRLESMDPLVAWENRKAEVFPLLVTILPMLAWNLANILQTGTEISDIRNKAFQSAVRHTRQLLDEFFA